MTLKEQIQDHMKTAMKAKDNPRRDALRLILAAVKQIEVDERIDVDDARMLTILDKMVKQRRDSIEQFTQGNRPELVAIEEFELNIIQEFMPTPLSEKEVDDLITAKIATVGASSMQDMGKVMGALKPELQGRADMSMVSAKIKAKLA